jgi:hypothetical protein
MTKTLNLHNIVTICKHIVLYKPLGDNFIAKKKICKQLQCFKDLHFDLMCLMPLSSIFQLYHGDQF